MQLSEYQKQILSDPKTLREKLEIYLQTPEKVEIYASACEKFLDPQANEFTFKATWSWWAFFATLFFFLYRKAYTAMLCTLLVCVFIPVAGLLPTLIIAYSCAVSAKFIVCSRFVKILDMQSDEELAKRGGKHETVILLFAILLLLYFVWAFGS
ncbi:MULTISPECIES: DUF2628 domain-containing protein [Campylobacter]|jgi:hypothetical protein|uniref:Hypothetical membrane protein n=1 Tax=Campylobacter curvus (strain 525.92) TaxID=360105 RepID=A7GZH9_CAMC5|nr:MULTISPECIES: DUF2628 domain-containing protein [Campylobacter]EAU01297.1 hypothetical membrane protein [Campylobacter curvus 525.92]EJP75110.1 PF10947 family protein [Campylobacter sp. FOBRC14]